MSVIVSNGNTTLNTALGFYRAEAYNMGAYCAYTGVLSLNYARTIYATFANAGNCQGIIIDLYSYYSTPTNDRSVQANLQENVVVTLTIASPGVVNAVGHGLAEDTPVIFATTGALPTGLTAGTTYYVMSPLADSFNVSATPAGGAINFTGTQSGVQSYWVSRATKTLTATEICNGSSKHSKCWVVPFVFTTPYAVDITASKWRFSIIQTGGTTGTWNIATSDATNPFYISWCDNTISFADNDCVVCKNIVVIDKTATFRGVLGTGETIYGTCAVICNGSDLTKNNIANLVWENPPVASYTLTINGRILYGSGSAMRIGSSINPIPFAQQAVIDFITPTVGTAPQSGFLSAAFTNNNAGLLSTLSFFAYGATPTVRKTTLSADANSGQKVIVTTDVTGWAPGDLVCIGKEDKLIATNYVSFVIDTIVGNTITLTANLGSKRLAGGTVFTLNGYGIKFTSSTSASSYGYIQSNYMMNYCEISGCCFDDVCIVPGTVTNSNVFGFSEDTAYTDSYLITNCAANYSAALSCFIVNWGLTTKTSTLSNCYVNRVGLVWYSSMTGGTPLARSTIDGCVSIGIVGSANRSIYFNGFERVTINNCRFENMGACCISPNGFDFIITNSYFYGANGAYSSVFFPQKMVNSGVGYAANNQYERCGGIWYFFANCICNGFIESNSIYGQEIANTVGINIDGYTLIDFTIKNNTGAIATTPVSGTLRNTIKGTNLRFVDYLTTPNKDFIYATYGNIARTGDGLADTTVHTAGTGKFALRFEPIDLDLVNNLDWVFNTPTGNIQNKTMTVAVWCKINSATYYAGTHQNPKLTVRYDNSTDISMTASDTTDWQLLSVTFMPTTTFGQIVITLSGRTDATITNAYVYFDDFAVLYPAGYKLDLGAMDLWANAMPIVPPIATVLSAKDVWTALTTEDYGADTMGNRVKVLKNSKLLIGGEIIV
jgi:hypothetical protein